MSAQPGIDDVRRFWDQRPCNVRHSLQPIGSKEYFDEVERRKYFVEPHIPDFAEFDKWCGKRVLEIGCGIGTDAVNFARARADYTGVELSGESLALAKKRFEVYGLTGRLLQCNAEEVDRELASECYDLIYSFGVIHHSPHPERIVAAARQLIDPAGELRIMLYAKNSWKNFMIEEGFDQPEAQTGCPIANTYTKEEVTELLTGFQIDSITQDHIFPYRIEDYVEYRHRRQPWFEHMPEQLFRALERRLGWHMLIKAHRI
jgi:SAM-dependent methyltransferase